VSAEAELQIIRWRDIPAQVIARRGRETARRLMPESFQEAIDAAAMVAGLTGSDEYAASFRTERRPCGEDLEAEAEAAYQWLLAEWTPEVLRAAVRSGGLREGGAG
jgi:hypothetical protein